MTNAPLAGIINNYNHAGFLLSLCPRVTRHFFGNEDMRESECEF